jgi:hypothetical protein
MELHIWNVSFELHYDYMDEGEFTYDAEDYTVVAPGYDSALETAEQIAMAETSHDESTKLDHYVTEVRLTQIKRGTFVDGIAKQPA